MFNAVISSVHSTVYGGRIHNYFVVILKKTIKVIIHYQCRRKGSKLSTYKGQFLNKNKTFSIVLFLATFYYE